MYPPKRNDSNSRSKNNSNQGSLPSPPHKDINKVNKILENAKKYQQTKDNKRDYMLQGIMTMKKKQSDQDSKIRVTSKESQISSKGSGDQNEQNRRDIYRKVQLIDRNRNQLQNVQQLRRVQGNRSPLGTQRQVKRLGSYKSSDNLTAQAYRNQPPMERQSDKNQNNLLSKGYSRTQGQRVQHYTANNYSTSQKNQTSKIVESNQPQVAVNSQRQNNSPTHYQTGAQSYSSKYEQKVQSIRNNTQSAYTSQPQPYRAASKPQAQPKVAASNSYNYITGSNSNNLAPQSPTNVSNNTMSSPNPQMTSSSSNGPKPPYNNSIVQINTGTNISSSNNSQKPSSPRPENINNIDRIAASSTHTYKPETRLSGQIDQDSSQKFINQGLEMYNNAQTEQEKKQIALRTYRDQSYLKKLQTGQLDNEQNQFIKMQIERLNNQANQVRNKYYKSEEERGVLVERIRMLENQKNQYRKDNEQLKMKNKNLEFEVNTLQNYKSMAENQVRELKSNKQLVYDDLMNKLKENNVQLRKKALQITQYERACADFQAQLADKNYEVQRLNQIINKKQQQVLGLHEKQYQYNKLNSAQDKTNFEIKSLNQKISMLQTQCHNLRQQRGQTARLQSEMSNYRRQIQDMIEDMRDLERQLQQKDAVIKQYKNISYKETESVQVKVLQQQIDQLMRQKSQMSKAYEQRLLQKDKKISQLQILQYETKTLSQHKLGGLQAGDQAFEKILASQLQQINLLKRENSAKVSQIFTLKIELQNLRSQLQNQANKSKILSLQLQSNERNGHSITQSHLRAARNQIQSLNRRIELMNNSLEAKRKENLNKDQFIKQYIIGINKVLDVNLLISHLEKVLTKA